MSDTINLAGKDIIVDHVTTNDGSDTLRALQLMNAKRNRNGVDGITAGTCRIGARASGTTLEIYAYNPLNSYSSDFGDDYYVNTGYVDCNGQSCPVFIPGKHISFPKTVEGTPGDFYQGTWAIMIHKQDPLDEVWSVEVAIAEPDNSTPPVIRWKDSSNDHEVIQNMDTSWWVIGFFTYSSLDGIYNLFVNQNGTTPMSFLKDRFMQVMNDCDGADTDDFTNWATAMKCDAIFKRLAVLEAFVGNLMAQNLQIGNTTTGFCFQALSDDGTAQHNKVFNVLYNGNSLFRVDIDTGKIYFGQGFWYDPNSNGGEIHSTNDNVVIGSGGDIIINEGLYKSNLQCPSFRSLPKNPPSTPTYLDVSGTARAQITTMYNNVGTSNPGVLVPCLHSGASSVRFMRYSEEGSYQHYYRFFDASNNEVGRINGFRPSSSGFSTSYSTWANTSFTLTLGSATDVIFQLLKLDDTLSIGTLSSDTRKGELYFVADSGGATGTIHVKL